VFLDALDSIARGDYRGQYRQDVVSGDFVPDGWAPDFESYFDY
jgi:hypothetical protein